MAAWLADLAWPAVIGVMVLALAIAWLVEWVSWRDGQARAAGPRFEHRHVVEEVQTLPEQEPELVAAPEPEPEPEPEQEPELVAAQEPEPEPSPVAESVPDPAPVEAYPEAVPVSPEPVGAPQPTTLEPVDEARLEPMAPDPVEVVPEPESDERWSEPPPNEEPEPEALDAPAPKARRVWRGMSFGRVAPPEEPVALSESDPVRAPESAPAPASEREVPLEVEPRPDPQARPAYAPPRAVPRPQPAEVPAVVPRVAANVVRMPQSSHAREWNVWELESLARERARFEPERGEEWSYLFVHLRRFADARGKLPSEFDGLVRESFGELLETLEPA